MSLLPALIHYSHSQLTVTQSCSKIKFILHCRCRSLGQHVEVTAGRQTRLKALSVDENLLDLVCEPREVCAVYYLASTVENLLDLVYELREVCVVCSPASTVDSLLDLVYEPKEVCVVCTQPAQWTIFWTWSMNQGRCVWCVL